MSAYWSGMVLSPDNETILHVTMTCFCLTLSAFELTPSYITLLNAEKCPKFSAVTCANQGTKILIDFLLPYFILISQEVEHHNFDTVISTLC